MTSLALCTHRRIMWKMKFYLYTLRYHQYRYRLYYLGTVLVVVRVGAGVAVVAALRPHCVTWPKGPKFSKVRNSTKFSMRAIGGLRSTSTLRVGGPYGCVDGGNFVCTFSGLAPVLSDKRVTHKTSRDQTCRGAAGATLSCASHWSSAKWWY